MAQQSDSPPDDAPPEPSLSSQIWGMVSAFWASRQRMPLIVLALALVAVVGATAYAQIRLNAWNQPFYNALTRKDMPAFLEQLGVFAVLAGVLLVLNVAQTWLNQTSKVVLREGLVRDLLNEWLAPMRAFELANSGAINANPDQRLHADAQHLTDLSTDLGIGLLQSTLLLASFIGVLWGLSQGMFLSVGGYTFAPPGYMVWCALFYAGAASFLSWRVGRRLIALDAEHYAREAELRFALVRVNEEIEGVALHEGEADERRRIDIVFESVLDVSRRIVGAVTRLTWVTAGYGWFTIIAPILVAAPGYFAGDKTFGELMMVVGAFNQVQQSLRWFVDNFSNIADWRATLLRVASFRETMRTMDSASQTASRIVFQQGDRQTIVFDNLHIAAAAGGVMLSETHVELKPGEHVLIVGQHGAGKTLLFRAIGGLWPWGSGRVALPPRDSIVFLPTRAYVPPGSLRAAIAYPHPTGPFRDSEIAKALADVGLQRLEPLLDKEDRWDRVLNDDAKHCLAVVRIILQRPQWVVLDDVLQVVDAASRERIETLFTTELTDIGVLNIGRDAIGSAFFTRTLHLVADPQHPLPGAPPAPPAVDQTAPARKVVSPQQNLAS
jgi:putative ATP-binding cassette transporter